MTCCHDNAEPVTTSGTTVAYLCPDCDTQLAADFGDVLQQRAELAQRQAACPHDETQGFQMFDGTLIATRCDQCGAAVEPEGEQQ